MNTKVIKGQRWKHRQFGTVLEVMKITGSTVILGRRRSEQEIDPACRVHDFQLPEHYELEEDRG